MSIFERRNQVSRVGLHYLVMNYNTRSTQKSPVRQQNASFETEVPGSTQKCPVRHTKMPSPACISWHCHHQTPPLPPLLWWTFFFSILFKYFVFKNPYRNENEIILMWIKIYSISLWNLKCIFSFLFVMTIRSAAINKCYRYCKMFCQFLYFLFDCSIKTWHASSALLAQ